MKITVIGAAGTIGNALFKAFSSRCPNCVGLTTKNIPALTMASYDLPALRPHITVADLVIYCAGVTKFAECEQFPEKSSYLNAQLPTEVLKNLSANQNFVYFSSPIAFYDFGASKTPAYALHKRMAEEGLQRDNALIIRPSKVIESANIIREWKTALSKGEKITAFADQSIAPINTALLAGQLLQLIGNKRSGAYNFSAGDCISYLDLAKALCAHFKLDPQLIASKSARNDNPFYFEQDVLDCSAAQKTTGYVPPRSKDIVNDYFKAIA